MIVDNFQSLNERFCIRDLFSLPSYLDDYFLRPDRHMLLIDGSLRLNQDLILDWGKLETLVPRNQAELYGLVVLGDLIIDGGMLNTNMDGGPLLLVRGNLVAHNLLAGGADIIINRNANIRDAVFSNYNHGCLTIRECLYAGLFVMRDHCFGAREVNALHKVEEDIEFDPEEASDEDIEHLRSLNSILSTPIEYLDDLEKELRTGRHVLKSKARSIREIPESRFYENKEDVIEFVKHSKYVTADAVPLVLQQDRAFMLQLTGLHPDIYNFLKNRWHLDPEFMCAGLDARNPNVGGYIKYVENEHQRRDLESRLPPKD